MAKARIELKTINDLLVALKDINSKFDILIESNKSLNEKMDKILIKFKNFTPCLCEK
ncbi:hypothetical protein KAI52_03045 [Candidatus Parcubacteria bacterium]|nr:hypothetical protein [Candidatus Parcubacteria bacterium]